MNDGGKKTANGPSWWWGRLVVDDEDGQFPSFWALVTGEGVKYVIPE